MKIEYSLNGHRTGELLVRTADGEVVFADRLDLLSLKPRRQTAEAIAARIDGDADAIDAQLLRAAVAAKQQPEADRADSGESWTPSIEARNAGEKLLGSEQPLRELADLVGGMGIAGERSLVALGILCGVSRLLPRPLYLLIQGEPSSGKSAIAAAVAKLLPPSAVINATDLTPQALFYLERDFLRGKLLLLGERSRQIDGSDVDRTRALRELIESGRLSKLVPVKAADGRIRTERLELEGCPAIIETCSHGQVAQEDLTRAIVATTDDSAEQTRRVLRLFAERAAGGELPDVQSRIEAARAALDALEPWPIVNPLLRGLAERFPANVPEARRAFARLSGVAAASALLHQRQRERRGDAVAVNADDLTLSLRLLGSWLSQRLAGGASDKAVAIWEAVRDRTDPFTMKEVARQLDFSKAAASRAISYLVEQGALAAEGERFSRRYRVARPDWTPGDLDIGLE